MAFRHSYLFFIALYKRLQGSCESLLRTSQGPKHRQRDSRLSRFRKRELCRRLK